MFTPSLAPRSDLQLQEVKGQLALSAEDGADLPATLLWLYGVLYVCVSVCE